ncbi:MAG: hypothetical protein NTV88_06225, partial [Candidatus Micrarchaeota archaeon]|nr:hypothetical protein [Candidatus Micrarchaeota archaeon]
MFLFQLVNRESTSVNSNINQIVQSYSQKPREEVKNIQTTNKQQNEVKQNLLNLERKIADVTDNDEKKTFVEDYQRLRLYFDLLIKPIETIAELKRMNLTDESLEKLMKVSVATNVAVRHGFTSDDVLAGVIGTETSSELDGKLTSNLIKLGKTIGVDLVMEWRNDVLELQNLVQEQAQKAKESKPHGGAGGTPMVMGFMAETREKEKKL